MRIGIEIIREESMDQKGPQLGFVAVDRLARQRAEGWHGALTRRRNEPTVSPCSGGLAAQVRRTLSPCPTQSQTLPQGSLKDPGVEPVGEAPPALSPRDLGWQCLSEGSGHCCSALAGIPASLGLAASCFYLSTRFFTLLLHTCYLPL